jgi:hypothetical protein
MQGFLEIHSFQSSGEEYMVAESRPQLKRKSIKATSQPRKKRALGESPVEASSSSANTLEKVCLVYHGQVKFINIFFAPGKSSKTNQEASSVDDKRQRCSWQKMCALVCGQAKEESHCQEEGEKCLKFVDESILGHLKYFLTCSNFTL